MATQENEKVTPMSSQEAAVVAMAAEGVVGPTTPVPKEIIEAVVLAAPASFMPGVIKGDLLQAGQIGGTK